jgi:hypothetical protein
MGAQDKAIMARLLAARIEALPDTCMAEIEDFIAYLTERAEGEASGRALTGWAGTASAAAFARVWDNPEDNVYDAL